MKDVTGAEDMTGVEDMMTGMKRTTGAETGKEATTNGVRNEQEITFSAARSGARRPPLRRIRCLRLVRR